MLIDSSYCYSTPFLVLFGSFRCCSIIIITILLLLLGCLVSFVIIQFFSCYCSTPLVVWLLLLLLHSSKFKYFSNIVFMCVVQLFIAMVFNCFLCYSAFLVVVVVCLVLPPPTLCRFGNQKLGSTTLFFSNMIFKRCFFVSMFIFVSIYFSDFF